MQIAGGLPVFPQLRQHHSAKERVVDPAAVIEANPEVIIASWCGRKVSKEKIRAREGWQNISAIREGHIYEVKSTYVLQPGPAALTEGVRQLHAILARAVGYEPPPDLAPEESLDPDLMLQKDRT
jgi:iron complex transport system substrate-binding protein